MLRRNRRITVLAVTTAAAALAATLVSSGTVSAAAPALSIVRINVGGPALTDVDGYKWSADNYFVGGKTSSTEVRTVNTRKQYVFKDDRYAMTAYRIPVVNATYDVSLLESEQYFDAPGKRVFTVTAEGKVVAKDYDIFVRAGGKNRAAWIEFRTTVTDGVLTLDFVASVNHAKVNGISVTPAAAQPTASPTPSASPSVSTPPSPDPEPAPPVIPQPTATSQPPTPEPTSTAPSTPPTADPPPARSPVMWGMDDDAEFDAAEAEFGRRFALARQYRRIDQSFVSSRGQSLVNGGRSLVVSVRARTSSAYVPYSEVTAGRYDATFVNGLRSLNNLATPAYFIFQHEADSSAAKASCVNQSDAGCGPEFVAAWRHIYNLAKTNGFNKVIFAWTVTGYGFNPQTNVRNNHYWPGAAYTDWIGVDAYNGGCNESWYGTFAQMLEYTLDWAKTTAPNKPIILPEWGATEGSTPAAKADFFNGVTAALNSPGYENIHAILYWNQAESGCDFRYTSTSGARAAFKSLALTPLMAKMP